MNMSFPKLINVLEQYKLKLKLSELMPVHRFPVSKGLYEC